MQLISLYPRTRRGGRSTGRFAETEAQGREEASASSFPRFRLVRHLLTSVRLAQIYATSEERKQRNRQAQAAFRERRTEYIKQLENTIKLNEETLQSLQQSHRSAADECLMLRYKNSLLERILLEKGTSMSQDYRKTKQLLMILLGIDVQAELRLKSGSPSVPPVNMAPQMTQPSPLSRPPMTQQPTSRISGGIAPKPDTGRGPQAHREGIYSIHSPQLQPTPSSHVSSPSTAKSPGFPLQSAISPTTTSDIHSSQQRHTFGPYPRPHILPHPGNFVPGPSIMTPSSAGDPVEPNMASRSSASGGPLNSSSNNHTTHSRGPSAYYMSPFQKPYEQLGEISHSTDGDLISPISNCFIYRPRL